MGNTGDSNTGHWNAGIYNSGNFNSGDYNTGDYNTGSHNTGCFMTKEPKIWLFNEPSDWTFEDWQHSMAYGLLFHMPKLVEWVPSVDMTPEEMEEHPEYKTTRGYLKRLDVASSRQAWWNDLTDEEKDIIKALPNFDPDIFEQCTGIRVE